MWHTNKHNFVSELKSSTDDAAFDPKRPYVAAIKELSKRVPNVRAVFDHFGHLRTVNTEEATPLFSEPMLDTPDQHALKFLTLSEINNAFALRHANYGRAEVTEIPTGYRVDFPQELTVDGVKYPVRGGYLQVFMDRDGNIFQVHSTLRHGRRPSSLDNLISEAEAIAVAKKDFGVADVSSEKVQFVFSAHKRRIDPVYEVTLAADNPRRVVFFLVKATTGEIVYRTNLIRSARRKNFMPGDTQFISLPGAKGKPKPRKPSGVTTTTPVQARTLLRIPDPNTPIGKQVHDAIIESLPDPKVLKNDNVIMYAGGRRKEVRAKADGTFNYKPNEPEFMAVVTFFALQSQMELFKSWGMVTPSQPIEVFVHDPGVRDNAYFDPMAIEIHIGVGSGLPNGLNTYIVYDLGVSWHENGHYVVYLQTPGRDLLGSEGGAIHEAVGDVLGQLLMDFWFRHKFASQLGHVLTASDINAADRIIGAYAAPPSGIRNQKNKKRTPKDKTGEPHDDGLIVGGAMADLLVGMAGAAGADVEKELANFGKLTLAALAIVPAHKVTFRDLLNAYLTADGTLFKGAYKQLIIKSFGDHGIRLAASRGGSVPVIIIT